jgi:phosphatidylserine/phosphatidylglycerophosphate/cardiolipin synthase-like enzyme
VVLADRKIPFFEAEEALILRDKDYYQYLLCGIRRARKRVVAVQFAIDIRTGMDVNREVVALCHALAEASWRGLDVRVIVNRLLTPDLQLDVNRVAHRFLAQRGVRVRAYRAPEGSHRDSVHSKLALLDDEVVLVGSHNWTPNAFDANRETSVAVRSGDLALDLLQTFERMWQHGEEHLDLV